MKLTSKKLKQIIEEELNLIKGPGKSYFDKGPDEPASSANQAVYEWLSTLEAADEENAKVIVFLKSLAQGGIGKMPVGQTGVVDYWLVRPGEYGYEGAVPIL